MLLIIFAQFFVPVSMSDICSYCYCDQTSAEVICRGEQILVRTVSLPSWSETLLMQRMILRHIPHFEYNDKLKTLRIRSCRLSHIHPFSFSALPSIETLDLSGNLLSELPEGCFQELSELKVLDLSQNKIRNLDSLNDIVSSDHILERFILANNPIEISSGGPRHPISRELYLSNTNIHFINYNSLVFKPSIRCPNSTECRTLRISTEQQSIMHLLDVSGQEDINIHPTALDMLSNATVLNLSGAKIPPNISLWLNNVSQVKSLNLSGSLLAENSQTWNSCGQQLLSLDISGMNLSNLKITRTCKLQFLKATDNILTTVRLESSSLKTLLLDRNRIHSWIFPPPGIALLGLKTLSISYNLIELLPSGAFSQYPQLEHLDISNNRFKNFSADSFPSIGMQIRSLNASNNNLMYFVHPVLPSLTLLDLSHNDIVTLHSHLLIGLPMLQYFYLKSNHRLFSLCENGESCWFRTLDQLVNLIELDLSDCNLEIIPNLSNLKTLRRLHLSNNKILSLDGHLFPKNLYILDLVHNNIHFLSNSTIEKLKTLKEVDLAKNPLICDCRLTELIFLFNNRSYSNPNYYYCFHGTWQFALKSYIDRVENCKQPSVSSLSLTFIFLLLLLLITFFLFAIAIIIKGKNGPQYRIATKYIPLDVNAVEL